MFILLEYNDSYEKNLKELKKYDYTPVILFKLILNNKNQIKEDLQKIKQQYDKIKPKYCAVQVTLEKIENSTIGTVNNLKNYFDIVIGYGGLNKVNRFFLEQTQIDFLQDPQNITFGSKIDFIHHFNSGLNHILCKYTKEKNIGYIFSLNFTQESKIQIPKEIGRINQNLRFARKYLAPSILNFIIQNPNQIKSIVEIISIFSFFDLSTQQKKESLNALESKISSNRQQKSPQYIVNGLELNP